MTEEKQKTEESATTHDQLSEMLGHLGRSRSELHMAMAANDELSGGPIFVARLRKVEDGLSVMAGVIETELGNIEDDDQGKS